MPGVTAAPSARSSSRRRPTSGPATRTPAARCGHQLGRAAPARPSGRGGSRRPRRRSARPRRARGWRRARRAPPRERAQEVAQPADPLRVEAVGRLVEHQHARVAEQRGGESEPLAHAERVALRAAPAASRSSTSSSSSSTRARGSPAARASVRRWLRPLRPGCSMPPSSTAPTVPIGSDSSRVGAALDRRACRWSGGSAPAARAASSSCRRRWGRGSRRCGLPRPRTRGRRRPACRRSACEAAHLDRVRHRAESIAVGARGARSGRRAGDVR